MSATNAVSLPLGPFDPERSELLRRLVDGLEPASRSDHAHPGARA